VDEKDVEDSNSNERRTNVKAEREKVTLLLQECSQPNHTEIRGHLEAEDLELYFLKASVGSFIV
jgi:hypothetical protein